jgi:type IV pilus assembly protein PilC
MATFTFKAVDLTGVPARGELEAESKQSVTDQLRDRGLIVLDINEQKTTLSNVDLFERF